MIHGVATRTAPILDEADVAIERLRRLLGDERHIEAEFLIELERFDRRRLYESKGFPSTWDFLRRELRLLDCAIYRRLHAARLLGRFPAAVGRLRDGRLCMTSLAMLRDVLTDANAERLFDRVAGLSKDQIKRLVAELQSKPVREKSRQHTIRKAPVPTPIVATPQARELRDLAEDGPTPTVESEESSATSTEQAENGEQAEQPTLFLVPPSDKRAEFRPISGDRYDISMRVSARFVDLLKELADAESHAVPDGNPETLLIRAMELLLERAGKKTGKVAVKARTKPANQPAPDPNSAYIPADLRREVFERDGHACTWPLASGERCGSKHCLEPDHIVPHAKGGKTEPANLRLVCRAHNQQAAREAFGREHIEARIRARKRPDD